MDDKKFKFLATYIMDALGSYERANKNIHIDVFETSIDETTNNVSVVFSWTAKSTYKQTIYKYCKVTLISKNMLSDWKHIYRNHGDMYNVMFDTEITFDTVNVISYENISNIHFRERKVKEIFEDVTGLWMPL